MVKKERKEESHWLDHCTVRCFMSVCISLCIWVDVRCSFWRRQWHPPPVLLLGKSHGWRSLEGCSPWGHWRSDTTERLHFHFSLSCIGEGDGNPLQCSCLENPRDRGAWWAAVYGVAQSQIRLKRLSSSSSSDAHLRFRLLVCLIVLVVNMGRCWEITRNPMLTFTEP